MAKVLLFNCADEVTIRQILTPMKISAVTVPKEYFHLTLGALESGKWGNPKEEASVPQESALVMCGFTTKQLDKLLLELRNKKVIISYKAVLTKSNATWDVRHFYFEMAKEKSNFLKMAMQKSMKKK